jgi:hypothetical protein
MHEEKYSLPPWQGRAGTAGLTGSRAQAVWTLEDCWAHYQTYIVNP